VYVKKDNGRDDKAIEKAIFKIMGKLLDTS